LGTDLVRLASSEAHRDVVGLPRASLDVSDRDAVLGTILGWQPNLVFHAGAWTEVDACESDPDRARRVNTLGARHVAEGCRRCGAQLVYVSTDYVFDGTSSHPYSEWDDPNPLSVYGRSKLAGEVEVAAGCPGATIVRTSWLWGLNGHNMYRTVLSIAESGGPLRFVDDQIGCPTFTEDLAAMLVRIGIARLPGLYHITNQGPTSWYGFAREVVSAAGRDPAIIEPISTGDLHPPRAAARPANSVLDNTALRCSGIALLPDFREALQRAYGRADGR
jgi:dTDP-4-dehydrorhamnose reductase